MSILRVVPLPAPVTLGGRPFLAAEYRVADLAELHAWASAERPDLYESNAVRLECGPRDREWKQLISDIIDQGESAGDFGSAINSPAGVAKQVWLSLRRHSQGLSEDACTALLVEYQAGFGGANLADVRRILRAAWGTTTGDMIRRFIDGPAGPAEETDWPGLFHRYLESGAATPFAELTLGQLRAWLSGGSDADDDRPDFAEVAIRRAEFFAELDEPAE